MYRKEKSFYMIYTDDIEKAFKDNNIDKYVILNEKLASIYVSLDFDENKLNDIKEIQWWTISGEMSSLIEITDNIDRGESVDDVVGVSSIDNNPYLDLTGKSVLVAVIDSGIDYLNKDFIDENNQSKIAYLWDQQSDKKAPPKNINFGSEYTREDINKAIKEQDNTLSEDSLGIGTMISGIIAGQGNTNREYRGIAKDCELVVVKLRGYENIYNKGTIGYTESDFLAAITYVTDIAKKEQKPLIINITVGSKSDIRMEASILETYKILNESGIIAVSGAGNEGNTDIHYSNNIPIKDMYQDVLIQSGENENLSIVLSSTGPDKIGLQIISPSGDISKIIKYNPEDVIHQGRFNVEGTNYKIINRYPWLETGEQSLQVQLTDIKPGVWTIRLIPEFIIHGIYDLYLPNKNLISKETRFLDPISAGTVTKFALSRLGIVVGAYNNKINSLWIGSSKGSIRGNRLNPDLIAAGVDIISTYKDKTYNSATGTGISSSILAGSLALIMQYLIEESNLPKMSLFTDSLKAYLAIGAVKNETYIYPNVSQGYGVFNLGNTIIEIGRNL